ncbi:MAG: hypothetical protein Q6356_005785 [Candidatus Wukongarchaeota archaeon]|nr:hypothetical protein [Candidatus Wukongarchaeota archaeon]
MGLLRVSVKKIKKTVPLKREKVSVQRSVMVIVGGIAGIVAALRCAEHALPKRIL